MKILELIKKYKIYILSVLLMVFFFRSCGKSREVKRLEKSVTAIQHVADSTSKYKDSVILSIKNKHYSDLETIDTWIKQKDRGPQLMELHPIVDSLLKESNKK
jgi:hypothetical protein